MDQSLIWVMIANIIIWLGLGAYLAWLGASQRKLERRCRQLEILANEQSD